MGLVGCVELEEFWSSFWGTRVVMVMDVER